MHPYLPKLYITIYQLLSIAIYRLHIILYVDKKFMFSRLGGNYGTFLKYIDNPRYFRYEHTYRIATIINVTPLQVSAIIHNQIDNTKQHLKEKNATKK